MYRKLVFSAIFCLMLVNISFANTSSKEDYKCLGNVMFHEARGEGNEGMLMVAEVVLNRLKDPRFPKTICGVVNVGFHTSDKISKERDKYNNALILAKEILEGKVELIGTDALYFKTARSKLNSDFRKFAYLGRVKNHDFYKD